MSFGERKLDRSKPEIDFPEGEAPTELVSTDLVEGTGAEATPGKQISCHYVGVTFSAGEEFEVIEGWDKGLLGMKVGGRRRLEIPADQAYGSRGAGGVIGPDEALIFVVDLLDVR
jgi:peptidylprolyl isomerase